MMPRVRRAVLGGAVAAVAACTEVSTDPNAVLALQLDPPQLPSVVLGDSAHDSTGAVVGLKATAFNAQGDSVPGAVIRFLIISGRRVATVDTLTGVLFGDSVGTAQVIAICGALQTLPQTVTVVERPDSLSPLDSTHYSLDYSQGTLRDTLLPIRVRVLHLFLPDTVNGVAPYVVRYAFTYPAGILNLNPDTVQLVNAAGKPTLRDTTTSPGPGVGTGQSTLSLRATLLAAPFDDTVGIDVFAYRQDATPLPGSPVHFVIALHIH